MLLQRYPLGELPTVFSFWFLLNCTQHLSTLVFVRMVIDHWSYFNVIAIKIINSTAYFRNEMKNMFQIILINWKQKQNRMVFWFNNNISKFVLFLIDCGTGWFLEMFSKKFCFFVLFHRRKVMRQKIIWTLIYFLSIDVPAVPSEDEDSDLLPKSPAHAFLHKSIETQLNLVSLRDWTRYFKSPFIFKIGACTIHNGTLKGRDRQCMVVELRLKYNCREIF